MRTTPAEEPGILWYISKYFCLPEGNAQGGRGFELLRALSAQGHTCVAFVSDANHLTTAPRFSGTHMVQTVDGVTVVWVKTLKYRGARSARRILSWLHFELMLLVLPKRAFGHPDAVVASSLSLLSVISGFVLSKCHRARFSFEVRDIWPLTLTAEGGLSPRNPLVKALGVLERFGYRTADVIIGTMPNLGEHVLAVTGQHRDITCIPMGVASRFVDEIPSPDPKWALEHIPAGKFIVGYAGTIGTTNALGVLFDAADLLAERADIHFVFVGQGDLLSDYRATHAHKQNVTFAGAVPKEHVAKVLQSCDVLTLATHDSVVWRYGQSLNKLIDYMLSGKPVIASMTGFPSMLNESGGGVFVRGGNATALATEIERFYSWTEEERASFGLKGRSWLLANHSFERLATSFAEAAFGRNTQPASHSSSGRKTTSCQP